MSNTGRHVSRRAALGLGASLLTLGSEAAAFGEAGAFGARLLEAGRRTPLGPRASAGARWAEELVRRTSAPGRLKAGSVAADRPALLKEPFAVWCGSEDMGPLSGAELRGLERFLRLGGMLVVDDASGGVFGRAARREMARVLPETPPVRLDPGHVLYKSFYIVDRPVGRLLGSPHVDAVVRGKNAQVLFLDHDLLGALAREGESWALDVSPGGARQREEAVRFAVNIAMYALCSDYKDDQVHAPFIMRRRVRTDAP
jgi:hypothetical protein